jgi:uncharacterized Fe-S cluster-containing radical SAM superfamily protein
MPDKNIFCNAPWYELQIYWDGSLGFCCQESHKLYPENQSSYYNVRNMSIREWFDSEPMRQARLSMFGGQSNSICSRCYHEEKYSNTSRRHRSNQKSVIFTRTNFAESYNQSPGYDKFELSREYNGAYAGVPIDLHIDLGNYCNLTCKMCNPKASSGIASQYVKWNIAGADQYIGTDWTRDNVVWNQVLTELSEIPNLSNVHFMGGETLITKRFEDFVDFMIAKDKLDLNFSFVTNGTIFNESLLVKLKKFNRVGIEVSIETITEHNQYQRQGTNTALVLSNINKYLEHCDGNKVTLTIRPAIGLLTIGSYHTLLRYCIEHKLVIKGLIMYNPRYLDARILPVDIRQEYKQSYQQLIKDYNLESVNCAVDYNESDPNQISRIVKNQILQCINLLDAPQLPNSDHLLTEMVQWCRKWDTVHGYNAVDLYPELQEIFTNNGY